MPFTHRKQELFMFSCRNYVGINTKKIHPSRDHPYRPDFLVFFPLTHEVFFKTSISDCFRFCSMKNGVVGFDWPDQIINIFPDKYFQNKCSSLFQEYIGNVENRKIELNGSILIHACLSSGRRSDIRSETIDLCDIVSLQEFYNGFWNKYITLE